MFSLVDVMGDATTASSLAETVITWQTLSLSGTVCPKMVSQVGW